MPNYPKRNNVGTIERFVVLVQDVESNLLPSAPSDEGMGEAAKNEK